MKRVLVAMAAVLSFSAHAALIDFDGMGDRYWLNTVADQGYVFSADYDGMGVNNNALWPSNGTTHLMTWTNRGASSGFTLTSADSSVFSVESFEFAGGYNRGSRPVDTLQVSGWLDGQLVSTQTYVAGIDFFNASSYSLLQVAMLGIDSLQVEALGANNRAQFENFIVEPFLAQIPEPAALGLMGLGLTGLALFRRRAR